MSKGKFGHLTLKVIDTGLNSAAWNIAMDQALLEYAHKYGPFFRFLSFSPECTLVGYFQSVSQEIRKDYCHREGIEINRRITGGGAIYFDPSQLGWEIIGTIKDFPYTMGELSEIFGTAVAYALRLMGVNAEFRRRNDIEVNGRKISGMGGVTLSQNFLFQGTLLVRDRIERMLKSLKVPIEKLKPKEIDSVRERVTCLEYELENIPDREELKNLLMTGIKEYLGVRLEMSGIPEEVMERHRELLPYFESKKWIYKIDYPEKEQDLLNGYYRTDEGTVKISMTVNIRKRVLRNTLITGDFFLNPPESIFRLESMLKNMRFDKEEVERIVKEFFRHNQLDGLSPWHILKATSEVFKKWKLIELGFTPEEANNIFMVNLEDLGDFEPRVFLFPYCSKDTSCDLRYRDECIMCGICTIGDAYSLSYAHGLKPITIVSFEHLMETFERLKKEGITDYIGSCCEPFYVKHQEEFFESGLRGILVNIENTTCYELDKAKEAYAGRFESQTNLNLPLIKKVLGLLTRIGSNKGVIK